MQPPFDLGERVEGGNGPTRDAFGQAGLVHEPDDVGCSAVHHVAVVGDHVNVRRGDAAT